MSHNIMLHCTTCGVTSAPIENFHTSSGVGRAYEMLDDWDLMTGLAFLADANLDSPLEDLGPGYRALMTIAKCVTSRHVVVPCADYGAVLSRGEERGTSCTCPSETCPVRAVG